MIQALRQQYNNAFTEDKYQQFLGSIEAAYPGALDFRIAETPLFIPKDFKDKMLETCNYILNVVTSEEYKNSSAASVPHNFSVPNEDVRPQCIAFDFGICSGKDGLEPQLIELQGFPSLFAWQIDMPVLHAKSFATPAGFSVYLSGLHEGSYIQLLRQNIIADAAPEEVVLLEILPHTQKTRLDFYATQKHLGIAIVCLTELVAEGRNLFYVQAGKKQRIKRIYNRVIFDDLQQQSAEVQEAGKILLQDLDVTWVPHPSWFYKISKFTLPFLQHPYVPFTQFLSNVKQLPADLENYVAKPLFSFAGQGVLIDVTEEDLKEIDTPENWILQRKVQYAAAIETPDGPAKAEIRLFYFWDEQQQKYIAANNLARLSKGKMVGVRYNKDKQWVGGSFCLFEQ